MTRKFRGPTVPAVVPLLAVLLPAVLPAVPARAQAPAPAPCAAPEHRQFDFWIGTWDVQSRDGKPVGTNRIERILGGCVLLEQWTGARGGEGRSFNQYDAATRRWRQTWVDNFGTRLDLAGGLEKGSMVLSGVTEVRSDSVVHNRITWTPRDADRVVQHWESSSDGGRSWSDVFWGLYVRRKADAK